jgi:hypothetical protein
MNLRLSPTNQPHYLRDKGIFSVPRTILTRNFRGLFRIGIILLIVGCTSSPNFWPPTPNPGTGVIIGQIKSSTQGGYSYTAQDLYLGKLIPANQPDAEPAVSFTYGVDPSTSVRNPDGTFAFTDVVPGTYVLIIWTPVTSFVIISPEGGLIKVIVEPDKTTDLGTVILP